MPVVGPHPLSITITLTRSEHPRPLLTILAGVAARTAGMRRITLKSIVFWTTTASIAIKTATVPCRSGKLTFEYTLAFNLNKSTINTTTVTLVVIIMGRSVVITKLTIRIPETGYVLVYRRLLPLAFTSSQVNIVHPAFRCSSPAHMIHLKYACTKNIIPFVEGLVMFVSSQDSRELGWSVASAMSIHNLTEGFMIALPLYFALQSRTEAFSWAALLGGLSQPLGALMGVLLLQSVNRTQEDKVFGVTFGLVSGMMTLITVQVKE